LRVCLFAKRRDGIIGVYGSVMRSRATFLVGVLMLAALLGGVTASSVAAATSTTVTWKVSSLTAGQVKSLSAIATSNSPGVKTWSKTGSCVLSPKSNPPKLTMGTGASCTLTLKIAKSGKYPAKTSDQTITRKPTVAPTTTTTTIALTCAMGGSCAVGDTGPGGGIVFYDAGSVQSWGRFLEAACAGWQNNCDGTTADPAAAWGCYGDSITGAGGLTIGTGEQNTTAIVNGCTDAGIAANSADDLVLGDQSDWFLPSKDELNQMYIQQTAIGGFSTGYYWSSSEHADISPSFANYMAWYQLFNFGVQSSPDGGKYYTYYVRPVRAF